VDIRTDTLNIDPERIEAAMNDKTKAILVVHYGGVAAEMDTIQAMADKHGIPVIEDTAHAFMASYKGRPLGTLSQLGCLSFDVSKNIHSFKGGALIINNGKMTERAHIIMNRGTNRADFDAGRADFYTWMETGSNYTMSPLTAYYLHHQLLHASEIQQQRLTLWKRYYLNLNLVKTSLGFRIPEIPKDCEHNGHIFYLICKDKITRDRLITYLASFGISAAFHYIPLHSSPAGLRFGRFNGTDCVTTQISETLVRLPLFHELHLNEVDYICEKVTAFFNQ
jgi:dTDP-4-amino-4,6-dideoxygalactose transaminase